MRSREDPFNLAIHYSLYYGYRYACIHTLQSEHCTPIVGSMGPTAFEETPRFDTLLSCILPSLVFEIHPVLSMHYLALSLRFHRQRSVQ